MPVAIAIGIFSFLNTRISHNDTFQPMALERLLRATPDKSIG